MSEQDPVLHEVVNVDKRTARSHLLSFWRFVDSNITTVV